MRVFATDVRVTPGVMGGQRKPVWNRSWPAGQRGAATQTFRTPGSEGKGFESEGKTWISGNWLNLANGLRAPRGRIRKVYDFEALVLQNPKPSERFGKPSDSQIEIKRDQLGSGPNLPIRRRATCRTRQPLGAAAASKPPLPGHPGSFPIIPDHSRVIPGHPRSSPPRGGVVRQV